MPKYYARNFGWVSFGQTEDGAETQKKKKHENWTQQKKNQAILHIKINFSN